jgi:hypothetical protein
LLRIQTKPVGATVRLDGHVVGISPVMVVAPAGAHTAGVRLDGHESRTLTFELSKDERDRFLPFLLEPDQGSEPSTTRQKAQEPRREDPASDPSAADLLQQARQLMSAGQWSSAAAAYRELRRVHPNSAEAKTVLVALGQLQLDRLGQPAAAKRSFSAYLAAGGGALSQEARFGKIRALRKLGAKTAEATAIREFLDRHPDGLDAAALRRRLAELDGS